ncbi:MAG: hypothetical protein WHT46_04485, partial [Candidatus Geothermincolales bacterium]
AFYSYPRKRLRHILPKVPWRGSSFKVRRRSQVVGAFFDLISFLMLAAARLKWTEERLWEKKRYMDIDLLSEDLVLKPVEVKTKGA